MDIAIEEADISFSGFLNERTDLEPVRKALSTAETVASGRRITLDFSGIEKANSCGILAFIKLLKPLKLRLHYRKAPVWLVEQFNIVEEFFNGDVIVTSFSARFYCPKTDTLSTELLHIGKDIPILDDYSDFEFELKDSNGNQVEPDFDIPSYLNFIALRAEHFRENTP